MFASFGSYHWGSLQAHGAKKVNTIEAPLTEYFTAQAFPFHSGCVLTEASPELSPQLTDEYKTPL